MESYGLEFTMELTHGAIHNLGNMLLLYRIRALTYIPAGDPGKALVVFRGADWNLNVRELRLTRGDIDGVVERLHAVGLPERSPRVEAAPGNPTGWQQLYLSVTLNDTARSFNLILEYGGAIGEDAEALRELVRHLLGLAGLSGEESRLQVV